MAHTEMTMWAQFDHCGISKISGFLSESDTLITTFEQVAYLNVKEKNTALASLKN